MHKYREWDNSFFNIIFRAYFKLMGMKIINFSSKIIVRSSVGRKYFLRLGVPRDKIIHLPIGIDTEIFRRLKVDKQNLKKSFSIPIDAGPVIISVSRLSPRKNLATLFRVFQKIVIKHKGAFLVIVGKGPEKERLLELSRKLNIENNIRIIEKIHPWRSGSRPGAGVLLSSLSAPRPRAPGRPRW